MNINDKIKAINEQESRLVFDKFGAKEAWELGKVIVAQAELLGVSPAISIRNTTGYPVFQYGFEGTGLEHEAWMERKENTAIYKGMSTMKVHLLEEESNIDIVNDWFMDPMTYSTCPGAFPIRVKNAGIVGTIIVSGISVLMDHNLIVNALCEYLNINDITQIEE